MLPTKKYTLKPNEKKDYLCSANKIQEIMYLFTIIDKKNV